MNLQTRITSITSALIRFQPITTKQENTKNALHYIKKQLEPYPLYRKMYNINGYPSLAISNKPLSEKYADIILHGHVDVVPAETEAFKPKIAGDKLIGRGSCDMLGGLATLITFMQDISKQRIQKHIILLITSDEEVGGNSGTGWLLKTHGFRSRFFLTAEGERKYLIKYQQKGVLMLKLQVKGKGDHSSYTWKGENAIEKLYEVYQTIAKQFPADKKDPEHWYTTINLGTIHGGFVTNAIPDYAEATIDIRYTKPWKDDQEILSHLHSVTATFKGVTLEIITAGKLMNTAIDDPYLQQFNKSVKKNLKAKKKYFL